MVLNATSADLNSCIASESRHFFKRVFNSKQIIVITEVPLRARGPRQLTPWPPFDPTLPHRDSPRNMSL